MKNDEDLHWKLVTEERELFTLVHSEFWHGIIWDLLKKHSLQADFFLVRDNLEMDEVVEYLRNEIGEVCKKYGLGFIETEHPYRVELKVRFHNYGYVQSFDELSVVICKNDITMRMLPHSPMLKLFTLDEFKIVGNIVTDLCNTLFNDKLELFVGLLEQYKRVEESIKGLTSKTIEIAQNSIRSVYDATDEKFKNLVQRNLYSSLRYKGKTIRILHKEFLENPAVLMEELKYGSKN